MKQLLTTKQIAKILQVHPKSIYRFVSEKRLDAIRLDGNRMRFTEKNIADFLAKKKLQKM